MRGPLQDESEPARIQDPFGLRAYIQAQGAVVDAMDRLGRLVESLTATAQENPLFDFESQRAVHHGGFHQASLGLAIDGLNLALAQSAPLVISRITMLHDPAYTGAPPFLADGTDGSSGHMMVEYIAASAMAQLRNAAQPASLNTVVLSQGAEEDASFATQAVEQLDRAVDSYQTMLSIELLSAHRAISMLGRPTSSSLRRVVASLREVLPIVASDAPTSRRPVVCFRDWLVGLFGRLEPDDVGCGCLRVDAASAHSVMVASRTSKAEFQPSVMPLTTPESCGRPVRVKVMRVVAASISSNTMRTRGDVSSSP